MWKKYTIEQKFIKNYITFTFLLNNTKRSSDVIQIKKIFFFFSYQDVVAQRGVGPGHVTQEYTPREEYTQNIQVRLPQVLRVREVFPPWVYSRYPSRFTGVQMLFFYFRMQHKLTNKYLKFL